MEAITSPAALDMLIRARFSDPSQLHDYALLQALGSLSQAVQNDTDDDAWSRTLLPHCLHRIAQGGAATVAPIALALVCATCPHVSLRESLPIADRAHPPSAVVPSPASLFRRVIDTNVAAFVDRRQLEARVLLLRGICHEFRRDVARRRHASSTATDSTTSFIQPTKWSDDDTRAIGEACQWAGTIRSQCESRASLLAVDANNAVFDAVCAVGAVVEEQLGAEAAREQQGGVAVAERDPLMSLWGLVDGLIQAVRWSTAMYDHANKGDGGDTGGNDGDVVSVGCALFASGSQFALALLEDLKKARLSADYAAYRQPAAVRQTAAWYGVERSLAHQLAVTCSALAGTLAHPTGSGADGMLPRPSHAMDQALAVLQRIGSTAMEGGGSSDGEAASSQRMELALTLVSAAMALGRGRTERGMGSLWRQEPQRVERFGKLVGRAGALRMGDAVKRGASPSAAAATSTMAVPTLIAALLHSMSQLGSSSSPPSRGAPPSVPMPSVDSLIELLQSARDAAAHMAVGFVADAARRSPHLVLPRVFDVLMRGGRGTGDVTSTSAKQPDAAAVSSDAGVQNALAVIRLLARGPCQQRSANKPPQGQQRRRLLPPDVRHRLVTELLQLVTSPALAVRKELQDLFTLAPREAISPLLLLAASTSSSSSAAGPHIGPQTRGVVKAALLAAVVGDPARATPQGFVRRLTRLVVEAAVQQQPQPGSPSSKALRPPPAPVTPGDILRSAAMAGQLALGHDALDAKGASVVSQVAWAVVRDAFRLGNNESGGESSPPFPCASLTPTVWWTAVVWALIERLLKPPGSAEVVRLLASLPLRIWESLVDPHLDVAATEGLHNGSDDDDDVDERSGPKTGPEGSLHTDHHRAAARGCL